jgi:hypothetical protein
MYCVFIHGPAAADKLTVATALKARSGLPVFHNHLAVDTALSLFEFGSPGFVRLREVIWLAAFREAADSGRSFIFTFSPEASVPPAFIGAAVDVVEREPLGVSKAEVRGGVSAPSRDRRLRLSPNSSRHHDRNGCCFARGRGRTDSRTHQKPRRSVSRLISGRQS